VRNALYRLSSDREWRNAETYLYDPATRTVDRTDYIPILHDQSQYGDLVDISLDHAIGGLENALVVGAEYNTVRFVHTNDGFPGVTTTVDAFAPVPGRYIETQPFIPRYRTRTRQYGLFAEDRLKLSETLSVVAGVRFDHYHVRRLNLVSGAQQVDRKLEDVGYRLGLVYAPRQAVSFYAQYTTGSDPLGSLITTSAGQAPFELSTGRQVEVGAKGLFLAGRGEWTVAAFRIVKDKLLTRDLANPAQQVQVGRRSSKGVEASVAVQLGGGWSVEANGTVLDAQYDDFLEPVEGGLADRKGMTPFDTPERSANLWLSWAFTEGWRVYGGARYVGRQFGDNAESVVLPSYTVADAGVEWRPRPRYAVNLQVFNAFDERYATSSYGPGQWILARPRAVELRLSGRF
jgi:iron complex outermembrane receptor protein